MRQSEQQARLPMPSALQRHPLPVEPGRERRHYRDESGLAYRDRRRTRPALERQRGLRWTDASERRQRLRQRDKAGARPGNARARAGSAVEGRRDEPGVGHRCKYDERRRANPSRALRRSSLKQPASPLRKTRAAPAIVAGVTGDGGATGRGSAGLRPRSTRCSEAESAWRCRKAFRAACTGCQLHRRPPPQRNARSASKSRPHAPSLRYRQ